MITDLKRIDRKENLTLVEYEDSFFGAIYKDPSQDVCISQLIGKIKLKHSIGVLLILFQLNMCSPVSAQMKPKTESSKTIILKPNLSKEEDKKEIKKVRKTQNKKNALKSVEIIFEPNSQEINDSLDENRSFLISLERFKQEKIVNENFIKNFGVLNNGKKVFFKAGYLNNQLDKSPIKRIEAPLINGKQWTKKLSSVINLYKKYRQLIIVVSISSSILIFLYLQKTTIVFLIQTLINKWTLFKYCLFEEQNIIKQRQIVSDLFKSMDEKVDNFKQNGKSLYPNEKDYLSKLKVFLSYYYRLEKHSKNLDKLYEKFLKLCK